MFPSNCPSLSVQFRISDIDKVKSSGGEIKMFSDISSSVSSSCKRLINCWIFKKKIEFVDFFFFLKLGQVNLTKFSYPVVNMLSQWSLVFLSFQTLAIQNT